jgi:hypothetical protein
MMTNIARLSCTVNRVGYLQCGVTASLRNDKSRPNSDAAM